MKLRLSKWQGVLAAASLVLVGASSWAQPDFARGGQPGKMLAYATKELNLSDAQQAQARQRIDSLMQSIEVDRARLGELRDELEAMRTNFDDGKAITLTDEMGQVGARVAYEMAKAEASIYALLSPEQQEGFDELKARREARMLKQRHRHQDRTEGEGQ